MKTTVSALHVSTSLATGETERVAMPIEWTSEWYRYRCRGFSFSSSCKLILICAFKVYTKKLLKLDKINIITYVPYEVSINRATTRLHGYKTTDANSNNPFWWLFKFITIWKTGQLNGVIKQWCWLNLSNEPSSKQTGKWKKRKHLLWKASVLHPLLLSVPSVLRLSDHFR